MTANNGSHKPPPTAGAVDLNRLKAPEKARLEQAKAEMLSPNGLICPCGELIRDDGIEYLALVQMAAPSPQGPQATIAIGATTFHAADCPILTQTLAAERGPDDPQPLALRQAAPVIWLDEEQL